MPKPTLTLEARDQQIAALAAAGVRQGEIARRLGVHRNSVGRRLRLPRVQEHIDAMQAQVFERSCALWVERLDATREQAHEAWRAREAARRERRKERRGRAIPWQGQRQAEAPPLTQEPAPELPSPGAAMPREEGPGPAFYAAQEERWQARMEELKRWPVS